MTSHRERGPGEQTSISDLPSRLRDALTHLTARSPAEVRLVRSPYRFCAIGAHIDHQEGEVTGLALDRALHLAYVPAGDRQIRLRSLDVPGWIELSLDQVPDAVPGDWGNYARGAVRALSVDHELKRGITGILGGEMKPGGVSTSAALGVALLLALEDANEIEVSAEENIALDQAIENGYLGLQNGILDQTVILMARAGRLVHIDCRSREVVLHALPSSSGESARARGGLDQGDAPSEAFTLLAVYSGVEQALATTGYNQRVAECRRAAATLLQAGGLPSPATPRLRDVPDELFDRHLDRVDEAARRRAQHYRGEMRRVHAGLSAWKSGDVKRFSEIITETGWSSIQNYECGSPELIRLFEILVAQSGVLGARFAGAGFRGYCMALVSPDATPDVVAETRRSYLAAFPERRAGFHWYACRTADGASVTRS